MKLFSKEKTDYITMTSEEYERKLEDSRECGYSRGYSKGLIDGRFYAPSIGCIPNYVRRLYGLPIIKPDELVKGVIVDKTPKTDSVNHPKHYTDGKIEVIEYIEDKKLGFCLGNAVKYISRAGKKDPDKEVEDLKKAIWYLERRITEIKEGG